MNVVDFDCPTLQDRRLFGVLARTGLRNQPYTCGDAWFAPPMRGHAADVPARRTGRTGGRAGAAAGRGESRSRTIHDSNISARRARTRINPSSEFRSSTAGSLQGGARRANDRRARAFTDGEIKMRFPRRPLSSRSGGERSAHSGSFRGALAGTAVVAGSESVVELGQRLHEHFPRSGSAALAAAESQSDRPAL